ncbi:MAG: hypothetical protein CL678_10730 [Bdellovibrionaceae bacterium]|nr:hypothetical protein [Pseudobdellovibrionaceae bacterium]|tara:strand:- start:202 stop:420 length:219 start_codon:yes stop_codon:yes gene_type:complete
MNLKESDEKKDKPTLMVRIGTAIIFGLLTYFGLTFLGSWDLDFIPRIGVSILSAILGVFYGPKVWEVIIQFF